MESQYHQTQSHSPIQRPLPNATAVLVLGIVSIISCICYGVPGLICGIIALVLAGKDRNLYQSNPGSYTAASYNNLNTGKICAIIGLILSILFAGFILFALAMYGTKLTDPDFIKELQNNMK